jgi:hypothetical protein
VMGLGSDQALLHHCQIEGLCWIVSVFIDMCSFLLRKDFV